MLGVGVVLCNSSIVNVLRVPLGFLCPVHTPDGAPCRLLNHLSANTQVCVCMCKFTCVCMYVCVLACIMHAWVVSVTNAHMYEH